MGVVKSITCSNGRVTAASGGTVDTADISADAVTFAKIQNVSTSRLVGRYTAGSGDLEEITLGAGFSVSGGTLTYSGGGSGTVTSVGLSAPTGLSVSGSPVTTSGTLALSWSLTSGVLLGRTTAGTGDLETITVAGNLTLTGGVLTGTTSTEEVQDIVGWMVGNTDTVSLAYNDWAGTLTANVYTQMSITSDVLGLKLDGDSWTPGVTKYYGTDSGGAKGWHSFPAAGSGTVTLVALSLPAIFSVSGSPVTTTGTLTASLASQTANLVWASPNGSSGVPTFRSLVLADLPSMTDARLLGRSAGSSGSPQEITIGANLTLSGGTLAGTGSVSSVGLSMPGEFSVSSSPITTSGTLNVNWGNQTANRVFAGPASGSSTVPTFRALVSDDLPALGVNSSHLASNAVTTAKITDANVTTAKIADAAITAPKIADGNVTLAKLPTFASARLIGYDGVSTAAQNLSIGSGLALSGTTLTATTTATVSSVGLSLPAIFSVSGSPVTSSGTLTATLATQTANTIWAGPTTGAAATPTFRAMVAADVPSNLIADTHLRQSSGLSVIGRSASATGNVADIIAASDFEVLRRSGTSIGFGSINLASSNAVTGALPAANGGTGLASYTTGDIVYASGSTTLSKLAVGSSSQVLGVSSGVPAWRDEYAATNGESVLGSAYTVSTTSFADTGLSVTLPAAGTYLVIAECRGNVNMSSGLGGVVIELYNTTDSSAVSNTERMCILANGTQSQGTGTVSAIITVAGSKTIRVNAKRNGAGTFTNATIESNTGGRSLIRYIRLY